MKKIFLTVLLALSMIVMLQAQEVSDTIENTASEESSASGFDWCVRMGYGFPFITNVEAVSGTDFPFGKTLLAFALSSLSVGGSAQYTIVPHLLSPGIYFDMHFNLLSWLFVGMFSNWEKNYILFQTGVRVFNQFKFGIFGFEPFFGFNNAYMNINGIGESFPMLAFGFVIRLGGFGFEYCYNSGASNEMGTPSISRITFSWNILKRR